MTPVIWNGKPITKPGLYAGIPMDVYHSPTICGKEPSVSHRLPLPQIIVALASALLGRYSPYNPGTASRLRMTKRKH